ncbi:MAG: glutathione S-transferase family protein [Alphaproteobacteria bacterium]
MTLTLIHSPQSRSTGIIWLLEELGAAYDIRRVTIRRAGSEEGLDPANPHPHGKVPALLHDGALIHERAAIVLYLTDLFPEAGLGPRIGDAKRGPYLTWLAYYAGVMEPSFVSRFLNTEVPRGTAGWVKVDEAVAHLENTLKDRPYLLGDDFSGADILFGGTFAMFGQSPIMPQSAAIADYAKRCVVRPAFARAGAKDNG